MHLTKIEKALYKINNVCNEIGINFALNSQEPHFCSSDTDKNKFDFALVIIILFFP